MIRRATWRRALTAGATAGLLACSASCQRTERVGLSEHLATAAVEVETQRIDLGTAAARPHLTANWAADERWGETSIVWGLGEQSRLEFYLAAVRPVTLTARGWPLPFAGLPPQSVAVVLNGTPLATWTLQPAAAEYAVALPAGAQRVGTNRLELTYGYARRPLDVVGTPDARPLAVAWDWLRFDGVADAARPRRQGDDLIVPPGSGVSFTLALPTDAALRLDAIAAVNAGDRAARLDISVERDGAAPLALPLPDADAAGPQRWSLPGGAATRIRFRHRAGGDVRLGAPRIDVPATAPVGPARAAPHPPLDAPPPVLLFVIDTLRADRVGCYGYARPTTPKIDAFAGDAVRFDHVVAQSTWTKPSMASLFTGLSPTRHGANHLADVLPDVPMLASCLADAGYRTAGIGTNGVVAAEFGFSRGFATYELLRESPIPGATDGRVIPQPADALRAAALRWLAAHSPAAGPFLLYLHATDPHDPYLPPEPFRSRLAPGIDPALGGSDFLHTILEGRHGASAADRNAISALYDGDVAFVDHEFGALLDDLRARDLYDGTLIVVVADHGEAFGEHGIWQHRKPPYDDQTRVPLLIKFPHRWRAGHVVTSMVQLVDVLPTVLDALGLPIPPDLTGQSLLGRLDDDRAPAPAAYSFVDGRSSVAAESIVAGNLKLIRNLKNDLPRPRLELYDLATDRGELHDLAEQRPVETSLLEAQLDAFRARPADAPEAPLDAALAERLRALGYAP